MDREAGSLIDSFGRKHNNLRISVTDRCNIRCTYCMPEFVQFMPRANLLTFEEITRFVSIASRFGVNKVRLTGGEPLVRADVHVLVKQLIRVAGVTDIGLTTNGVLLAQQAKALYDAGLRRVNISLDTLNRERFKEITRRDVLDEVMDGIETALKVGFDPIKINAVAMTSISEQEVVDLAHFCRERQLELRFIEFMPLEADQIWERQKVRMADDLLRILANAGLPAIAVPDPKDPHAPATDYVYEDGKGSLGIIASVSKPFCGSCNRIRLTAEGKIRNCLFALEELDVKTLMRSGADDNAIGDLICSSVKSKWAGHLINSAHFTRPERTMHSIGG